MTNVRKKFCTIAVCALMAVPVCFAAGHPVLRVGREVRPGFARPPLTVQFDSTSAPSGASFAPWKIRHAYGLNLVSNYGAGQTIAIVDAFDDPNLEADLAVFNAHYNLPACTTANGCLRKIYAAGTKPSTDAAWSLEISLDVEWAHAIAPQAHILLVEAGSNSGTALLHGVDVAVQNGASVVSMSWGGPEFSGERSLDTHFAANGVTFIAASGDSGHGASYPATSPYVLGVGGTVLKTDSSGNWLSETAWSGSGGGLSAYEFEPSYQSTLPIPHDSSGMRGSPDIAYAAGVFAIYDSVPYQGYSGWWLAGGTSAGAPQWAAIIAIANSMRHAKGKAPLNHASLSVYAAAKSNYSAEYHDITSGNDGTCGTICSAGFHYDYVTGLGSLRANGLIPFLVSQ